MIEARVAGCPKARVLHRVREFFLVERLARRFHRREQRGFRESLGRTRGLLDGFQRSRTSCAWPSARPGGSDCPARRPVTCAVRQDPAPSSRPAESPCPTSDSDRPNRAFTIAVITVVTDQIWSSCHALSRRGRSGRRSSSRPQSGWPSRRSHGRNNGVMIGDFGIVDEAASQRPLARTWRQMFPIRPCDRAYNRGSVRATSCDRCRLSVRG